MEHLLAAHDVALVRAGNPGPLTLSGTNTWVVGRDPCWVIDPGPALDAHLAAVADEVGRRGGAGGIALTHDHGDHSEGALELARRVGGVPVAAGGWAHADRHVGAGEAVGPLDVIALPGHAPDHLCFAVGTACFTGDAVLGEGSVFIAPGRGALSGYLTGLAALRDRRFTILLPGHGPPVTDVDAKLAGYIAHRLERERRLVAALDAGVRTVEAMLAAAWDDVPEQLRPAAAVTLVAHLDKLEEEGRLPDGVERPEWAGRSTLDGP